MSDRSLAPIRTWLAAPMHHDVSEAIERLRRAPDVEQIAVMPDVHLATDVCIGVVVATSRLIYPQAVGGDIGCGMLAIGFDVEATALQDPGTAGRVLAGLARAVLTRRRNRRAAITPPSDLAAATLSHPSLEAMRLNAGPTEFATLGSGNHFIELQSDEDSRLWMMVHSGSRGIGPAICDHHMAQGEDVGGGLRALDATSDQGARYLSDADWARRFADASRRAMAVEVGTVIEAVVGARLCWETVITTDHNHVTLERHGGRELWVHRKGAMPAGLGQGGVLPGSMGSSSFHVEGRGHEAALRSSAHGAGRALSRTAARAKVTDREFRRQMQGVWYDYRLSDQLRDEAPAAYKDIRAVLRAQRDLVKVTRVLRPVLNYKGA
ncbi:MAG TPA: RtcB family protein [Gemmatimonadales bacterium]|nr:RtcB family protein [Gemmatimonadales bacterium]